jgi:TRAP-type C4-dicarboxylate transport system permease small subunit
MKNIHGIPLWINRASFAAGALAAGLFALMALEMFISVFFRYILRDPLGWYEELTRFLLVWGAMLGMAYTLQEGRHIRVTTVVKYLPLKHQKYLEFIMDLIGIAVLGVFMWRGAEFTLFTHNLGEISGGIWGYPLWWGQLAIPVGGGLFILQYLPKGYMDLKAAISVRKGVAAELDRKTH